LCRNVDLKPFGVYSATVTDGTQGGKATLAASCNGAHGPKVISRMGVRWPVAFPRRTRQVAERMADRGVDYSTIQSRI
jgi:hypothetical protein